MRVSGADQAKLERINAEFLLYLQANFQRAAGILMGQHLGCLFHTVPVAAIPVFIVRELVIGR